MWVDKQENFYAGSRRFGLWGRPVLLAMQNKEIRGHGLKKPELKIHFTQAELQKAV
jgi:hypothetical protein